MLDPRNPTPGRKPFSGALQFGPAARVTSRHATLILLALLPFFLAGCSIQMKDITRSGVAAATPKRCADCHVAIYRDWMTSKHAHAFRDPQFLEATLGAQTPACLSCHAPQTVFTTGPVQTRDTRRDEGVNCDACHLFQGAQHGPYVPGPITPHATAVDPTFYTSAAFCGKCHAGTFAEWNRTRAVRADLQTCQDCHMPLARRKMTQATDLLSKGIVALHQERELHRHVFEVIPLPGAFEATVRRAPAPSFSLEVVLRNRLPHDVPTGDFGARRARVQADWLGPRSAPLASESRDLVKRLKTQLNPGAALTLRAPADAGGAARVRVRVWRVQPGGSTADPIWDETLPVSPTTEAPR